MLHSGRNSARAKRRSSVPAQTPAITHAYRRGVIRPKRRSREHKKGCSVFACSTGFSAYRLRAPAGIIIKFLGHSGRATRVRSGCGWGLFWEPSPYQVRVHSPTRDAAPLRRRGRKGGGGWRRRGRARGKWGAHREEGKQRGKCGSCARSA